MSSFDGFGSALSAIVHALCPPSGFLSRGSRRSLRNGTVGEFEPHDGTLYVQGTEAVPPSKWL